MAEKLLATGNQGATILLYYDIFARNTSTQAEMSRLNQTNQIEIVDVTTTVDELFYEEGLNFRP